MQIVKFKLYHNPGVRSARVKWLLHELVEDRFEVEEVAIYEGEQYSEKYLMLNPNHCVPTLEMTMEDGSVVRLIESGAMIVFLADLFPEKGLTPPSSSYRRRADYLQMIHFCGASIDMMLWQIRIHEHLLSPSERDDRTIRRYRKKFKADAEPQLKSRLEQSEFVCGAEFSAADCMIAHGVMWARLYHMCDDKVFDDYLSRLERRPAFQRAFADAGKFVLEMPKDSPVVELFMG